MPKIIRTALIALLSLAVSVGIAWASTEKKVALVIGNENYHSAAALKNPVNDATAIATELESIGFEVITGTDLTYDSLRDTIRDFTRLARKADVTMFYYAGHGIAVDGENYIVPVDAKLNDPVDWEFEVYNVGEILRLIDRSPGPSLIFLDACRDNPLAGVLAQAQGMSSRSLNQRGIRRIPTEDLGTTGSVIAYATEPGQVAADGTGSNSPFAKALLKHIGTANKDFASITSLITRDVLEMTDGQQRPRFDVSLTGPLVLNQKAAPVVEEPVEMASLAPATDAIVPAAPPVAAPATSTVEIEQIMFEAALASNDIADFRAFLDAFPNSTFAPLASNAVARLEAEEMKEEEVVVASAQTGVAPAPVNRLISAPLTLALSPTVRAVQSSEATENSLAMNKTQRKQVQLRLNLAGFNVGTPDGAIGRNTRKGITGWQTANGFSATGYLNSVQHQYLTATTDQAFTAHMAANPTALDTPGPASNRRPAAQRKNNNGISDFMAGAAAGAAAILLLKK